LDAIIGWPVAAGRGTVFITPGKKKVAGETEPPTLTPPHPVRERTDAASIASRTNFQFNLTCSKYKTT
jgi:hypothetical protein